MSTRQLNERSRRNLIGVHPDLVRVVERAYQDFVNQFKLSNVDFIVTEGLRTKKRQQELVAAGASWTMNSYHLTGHAIDVAARVGNEVRWDWPLYTKIYESMQKASVELGIPIKWGGNWKRRDGPHFQLTHRNPFAGTV